jgi:glyoxylase-like metal-dependent hydrolase (beta-lactamase superfamily II)
MMPTTDQSGGMVHLAAGISYCDLRFQGRQRIIAAALLHGPGGAAIVDPGPSSTLPALKSALAGAGLSMDDVATILLTHIHLDHAGATGSLVREHPSLRVYVHERGAPHMIDPSRLLSSASQLYGDAMDRLWGEVSPVPASALTVLTGGERLDIAGRRLDVAYTPGHASHHVSYYNAESGIAFAGDVAGIRIHDNGYILPPTPPPDIDLDAWEQSLRILERWNPETLFLTHFGPHGSSGPHIAELRDHLDLMAGLARASLTQEGTDEDREGWFAEELRRELQRRVGEGEGRSYEIAGRLDLSWRGLARYWRKRRG